MQHLFNLPHRMRCILVQLILYQISERNFRCREGNRRLVKSYFWTLRAYVPLFSLRMKPATRVSLRMTKDEASPDSYVGLIKYNVIDLYCKSRKETHRLSSAAFLSDFSVISFHTLKDKHQKTKKQRLELIRCKEIHSTFHTINYLQFKTSSQVFFDLTCRAWWANRSCPSLQGNIYNTFKQKTTNRDSRG